VSRVTTTITGPDGGVTRIVTRRSGCGCLTFLAAVVVLFGPAAWFPLPWAITAYIALGAVVVVGVVGRLVQNARRTVPQPPPAPPPV
jgi:hypothetical protein